MKESKRHCRCNPIGIRRGIEAAVATAVEALKNNAIPVSNKEAIAQVAAVSSRSEKVGEYISEAMEKVGKDGVITIEESRGMETELEVVEGCSLTVVTSHNTWSLIMKNGGRP